jgi:hypothetical protein
MQTLGLTDSAPRTEGRLKSLFWPFIKTGDDVDYLGTQGFWVCTFVAILSFVVSAFSGHEIVGTMVLLVFFLGGVGVREHSRYAAAIVGDFVSAGHDICAKCLTSCCRGRPVFQSPRDVDCLHMESRIH